MDAKVEARTLSDEELLITRVFDAPLALVFRIWENRDHMIRWLGPEGFSCTHLDLDFRPGGAWRACIVSDAHGENWMGGRFREIERNRRIVYTFRWESGCDVPEIDTVVTVTFEERDGKTVQNFHQAPFRSVGDRDSHVGGWNSSFNREQAYVEGLAKQVE
ncbi:SRPBCC domain-containing protein [Rhizobiaceae bacterium n13]|uniref:SRPBCC domain-containing protein n=1 Tax=Ferirhizobium litorale TaxID=2927786 RepID=A0AAE3QCA9_9HYPH|nr:SRPBCC domain-containing protein [Fererhizobium litorale]MDI7860600.1 SRPBCC domain-containing protein [Fererhizobium litorale]MDI7920748.1 SRPBCC domain-containing protein [Fererhizobium litorale]